MTVPTFLDHPIKITEQHWSDEEVPLVSVLCKTYMHEKYIRDAIKGFLMQKTTFKVEILIHDDASTDNTAKTIKEYESKYPGLIKATCQIENQYRKDPKTPKYIHPPKRRGKYIAPCEGDDYWTDPLKLQRQVEFLERNPDYSLCTHDYIMLYEHKNIKPVRRSESHPYLISKKIDGENAYRVSLQSFCRYLVGVHTASVMYKAELFKSRPSWAKGMQSGDFVRNIVLLKKGDGAFLPYTMSVLRKNPGGITQQKTSGADYYKLITLQYVKMGKAVPGFSKLFFIGRLLKAYAEMVVGVKRYEMPILKRIANTPMLFHKVCIVFCSYFTKTP